MTRNLALSFVLVLVAVGLAGIGIAVSDDDVKKPTALSTLAEKIKKGKIDVGKRYGLAPDQRYHKIHAEVLGLECTTCHTEKEATQEAIFIGQDMSPESPGPVDRRVCLGCHRAGPGRDLYGSGSP